MKLERVLVPVDFSPQSLRALESAREIAARFGARVHLLHVTGTGAIDGVVSLETETRFATTRRRDFWSGEIGIGAMTRRFSSTSATADPSSESSKPRRRCPRTSSSSGEAVPAHPAPIPSEWWPSSLRARPPVPY